MSRERSAGEEHVLAVTADHAYADAADMQLTADRNIRVTTAHSVGEALELVSTAAVDCIVSDHDLPDTDGVAFLEAVRAQRPELPFILFTSEGSEQLASRAISAGVTEYIVKERHRDQWDQLASLIGDVIEYSRTREALIDPKTRAEDILNAAHDSLAIVRDEQVEYLNDAAVDLLGAATRDDVVGMDVDALVAADGESFSVERLAAIQNGEETIDRGETRLSRLDGSTTPVEVTATAIEWASAPALILVVRDVSERVARQQELALKDRVLDGAPVGIAIVDATRPDNPVQYVNDQFERLTGYTEAECLGRNLRFLQGEATDSEPVAAMRHAIDEEELVTVELRNYRKDGTEFWNRVTIAPIRGTDGSVTHYVGFQEDVTERRENERTRRQLRRAVEAAGNVIIITDTDGTIEYVNPAFEAVTGYDSDEVIGETSRVLQSGEMSEGYYETLWETVLSGEIWQDEIINRRKSGELYYAQETIAPLTDDDGTVSAFVAIQTDITDQKEREAQLRQYERAIEGANDLICAMDTEYNYLFANQRYREYHGITDTAITGHTPETVLGTDTWETARAHVERALAGHPVHYRTTRERENRSNRTFDIRYYPLTDTETGETEGVVATLRDITPQRDREQQLDVLDRVLRHNLRNAMSVITGNAELIAAETTGETSELATNIVTAGEELLGVTEREREIVEVLSEARFVEPLDVTDYVARPVEQLRKAAPEAEIRLTAPETLDAVAIPQIEQGVEELIRNAIRHSDRDTPVVEVSVEGHEDTVEISVSDDGPGIAAHEQTILTGEEDIDPLYHGSGMGLWLVNWIVTHSDGVLSFEENDPRGSVVTIALPREQADDETTNAHAGERAPDNVTPATRRD